MSSNHEKNPNAFTTDFDLFASIKTSTGQNLLLPLFPIGRVAITSDVIDTLDRTATNATTLLQRHQYGDWALIPREP